MVARLANSSCPGRRQPSLPLEARSPPPPACAGAYLVASSLANPRRRGVVHLAASHGRQRDAAETLEWKAGDSPSSQAEWACRWLLLAREPPRGCWGTWASYGRNGSRPEQERNWRSDGDLPHSIYRTCHRRISSRRRNLGGGGDANSLSFFSGSARDGMPCLPHHIAVRNPSCLVEARPRDRNWGGEAGRLVGQEAPALNRPHIQSRTYNEPAPWRKIKAELGWVFGRACRMGVSSTVPSPGSGLSLFYSHHSTRLHESMDILQSTVPPGDREGEPESLPAADGTVTALGRRSFAVASAVCPPPCKESRRRKDNLEAREGRGGRRAARQKINDRRHATERKSERARQLRQIISRGRITANAGAKLGCDPAGMERAAGLTWCWDGGPWHSEWRFPASWFVCSRRT